MQVDRRTKMRGWILLGCIVVMFVIGSVLERRQRVSADVLVIREHDRLQFANDSDIDLHNCAVNLGGARTILHELPSRGRAELAHTVFAVAMSRAEFLTRSARSITMECYNDANEIIPVRVQ